MKKKIAIAAILFSALLLLPIAGFELYCLTLGSLKIGRAGYLSIASGKEGQVRETYFKDKAVEYVPLEELPDFVPAFTVALEDQNFYHHAGFDLARTFKSAIDDLARGKAVAGGSTITQQLARLLYLNNSKTLQRKIQELSIAKRIERGMSKNEIMELYLNEVFFGEDLYGIEAASQSYFAKPAAKLEKSEAALLLSLLPSPNNFSPRASHEKSREVYAQTVKNLYYRQAITAEDHYSLLESYPETVGLGSFFNPNIFYYQTVENELERGGVDTRSAEVKINSYLDPALQAAVFDIVQSLDFSSSTEVAVVVMEPKTGAVKALLGGAFDPTFNRATNALKAIGSTAKPILYTIALENGFTPLTAFTSQPTTFYLDNDVVYSPSNVNEVYANRQINMIEALAMSDNIYATKTSLVLGSASLTERLSNLGLKIDSNITNALGSFSLTPLQLTAIYNALADEGYYHHPRFFSTYQRGKKLYKSADRGLQLFGKKESITMSYMLRSTSDSALKTYSTPTMLYHPLTHRFAVKTGSTSSSSFAVGYNPQCTLGVYVGTDDNSSKLEDPGLAKILFQKIGDRLMEGKADYFYSTQGLEAFTMRNVETGESSFTYYR